MSIQLKKRHSGERVRKILEFSGVRLVSICKGTSISPPLFQYYLGNDTEFSRAKLRKILRFVRRRASRVEQMASILLEKLKD